MKWWHKRRKHDFIRVWSMTGGMPYCYYGCVTCDKVWPVLPRDKADWYNPAQTWRSRVPA